MKPFRLVFCALFVLCHVATGFAAESREEDPGEFISKLGDRVMAILEAPASTPDERRPAIRKLFDEALDYQHMARQVLGRFWTKISKSERDEFQGLFEDHVVAVYSAQFERYTGEQFEVLKHASWSDKTVTVWTLLRKKNGEETPMNFRLRRHEGRFRIFDLIVRGVSHVLIKRSEFSSIIINHGLPVLFDRLRSGRRVRFQWSRLADVDGSTALARILRVAYVPCANCRSRGLRSAAEPQ